MPAPEVLERPDVVEGVGTDKPAFFCADHARPPLCPGGIDSCSGQVNDNIYESGVSARSLGA
jgi:hypothetical protein